jgi:hypothetical protein
MFRLPNRCRKYRRLLSDRIDAPLPSRDEQRLQSHLARCRSCREEKAFYQKMKKTAKTMEKVTPPDYLWDRISVELDIDPWGGSRPNQSLSLWKRLLGFSPTGKINFAGAVLSCMLIAVLCLLPGGGTGDADRVDSALAQAGEVDAHLEYLSLYMVANGDQYPPEVREYYLGQIEGLDQKIRMIKSALNRFPDNHRVQAQLAKAYQHKIALYHRIGLTDAQRLPIPTGDHPSYNRGDFYE